VNAILREHPRALWFVTFLATILAGALLSLWLSLAAGCGSAPQAIASAAATVDVAVERAMVGWLKAKAQEIEDDVAAHEGTINEWCSRMAEPHQTAQRVICAARALGDLALAGQEIIDTAGADSPEWTDWIAALPPLVLAVEDAMEAADYEPPASVARALRMLGGLIDLMGGGDAADVPCEVTTAPAECLHLDDGEAP
jgi:hypothetical protein